VSSVVSLLRPPLGTVFSVNVQGGVVLASEGGWGGGETVCLRDNQKKKIVCGGFVGFFGTMH